MADPSHKLTSKEAAFVRAYVGEAAGNGAKAAILAGYARNSAKVTASRLLTRANVKAALAAKQEKLALRADVTAERVVQELARIGFSDIRDVFTPDGRLKQPGQFSDDCAAAIVSVEVTREKRHKYGEVTIEESVTKVRAADKIGALALLCRKLGLLNDKVKHEHTHTWIEWVEQNAKAVA